MASLLLSTPGKAEKADEAGTKKEHRTGFGDSTSDCHDEFHPHPHATRFRDKSLDEVITAAKGREREGCCRGWLQVIKGDIEKVHLTNWRRRG